MLTRDDYKRAVYALTEAQNLCGIVHSFNRIVEKVAEEARCQNGQTNRFIQNHPLIKLYSYRLNEITRTDYGEFARLLRVIKDRAQSY